MREKFKKFYEVYHEIAILLITLITITIYLSITYSLGYTCKLFFISTENVKTLLLGQIIVLVLFTIYLAIKIILKTLRVFHLRFLIRKRLYDFNIESCYGDELILALRERLGDIIVLSEDFKNVISGTKLENVNRYNPLRASNENNRNEQVFKNICKSTK